MGTISGNLRDVTGSPTSVSRVMVRAERSRPQGRGVTTTEQHQITVGSGGEVNFDLRPGPATLLLMSGTTPWESIPLVATDSNQTLAEAVDLGAHSDAREMTDLAGRAAASAKAAKTSEEKAKTYSQQAHSGVGAGEIVWSNFSPELAAQINASTGQGANVIPMKGDTPVWAVNATKDPGEVPTPNGFKYSYRFESTKNYVNCDNAPFQVDPDIEYYFSYWAKASLAGMVTYLECRGYGDDKHAVKHTDVGSSDSDYLVNSLTVGDSWKKYTGKIRFDEGSNLVYLNGLFYNHSSGSVQNATFWIAGMQLTPIGLAQD